jgi:hypothetical protein
MPPYCLLVRDRNREWLGKPNRPVCESQGCRAPHGARGAGRRRREQASDERPPRPLALRSQERLIVVPEPVG